MTARLSVFQRFAAKCQFEPTTGCVIWIGGKCYGRGKNIRYGIFRGDEPYKIDGKRPAPWLAHRWAAKYIHGLDIDELQVDHCCPNIPLPNTLCVEHVQAITGDLNRHLQTERRRHFIHLEVGLLSYDEIYGGLDIEPEENIPFYEEPEWLKRWRV